MKQKYLKLPEDQKKELVNKTIEWQIQGLTTAQVKEKLIEILKGRSTDYLLKVIVAEAKVAISKECLSDSTAIKALHIKRYDHIINKCMSVEELDPADIIDGDSEIIVDNRGHLTEKKRITPEMFKRSREKKIRAYDDALNTMTQKENLLQLVDLNRYIDINEDIDINVVEKKQTYDLSKLTFDQKVELMELMKKARKTNFEPCGVIDNRIEDEIQITVDTEAEVLPDNIKQIKQIAPPAETLQSNPVPIDPTRKLRENLARLAAQKFKEAGATLTDEEKKLLE